MKIASDKEFQTCTSVHFWQQWMLSRFSRFFMGIKVMFLLNLKSHNEPFLCPIFPLQCCKSNFCFSYCSEKSSHIVLIAIKLKHKGWDTNVEDRPTSRDTTIFYLAFGEGQKVMTGIWPLITSLVLLYAVLGGRT